MLKMTEQRNSRKKGIVARAKMSKARVDECERNSTTVSINSSKHGEPRVDDGSRANPNEGIMRLSYR